MMSLHATGAREGTKYRPFNTTRQLPRPKDRPTVTRDSRRVERTPPSGNSFLAPRNGTVD